MDEKKPQTGPEAEMLARVRTIAEETHKLRRELQESIRPSVKAPRGAIVRDQPGRRKKRGGPQST